LTRAGSRKKREPRLAFAWSRKAHAPVPKRFWVGDWQDGFLLPAVTRTLFIARLPGVDGKLNVQRFSLSPKRFYIVEEDDDAPEQYRNMSPRERRQMLAMLFLPMFREYAELPGIFNGDENIDEREREKILAQALSPEETRPPYCGVLNFNRLKLDTSLEALDTPEQAAAYTAFVREAVAAMSPQDSFADEKDVAIVPPVAMGWRAPRLDSLASCIERLHLSQAAEEDSPEQFMQTVWRRCASD